MLFVKTVKYVFFFLFSQNSTNEVFRDVLDREIGLRDYKNIDLKKSLTFHFTEGSLGLVKYCKFHPFFIKTKEGREKMFVTFWR